MKQFVKVSKWFGFNRNRLLYWEFFQYEGQGETAVLTFESGATVLEGADVQTFRNWVETEAEEAPETHQYTLFGQQHTQDQKQTSAYYPGGK